MENIFCECTEIEECRKLFHVCRSCNYGLCDDLYSKSEGVASIVTNLAISILLLEEQQEMALQDISFRKRQTLFIFLYIHSSL